MSPARPEPGIAPDLLRAYRLTRYTAEAATGHIGCRSTTMDALLRRHAARQAVLVTAWNPFSRRMPDGWNRRMQARLREHLRRRPCVAANGSLGRWAEDHLLVVGMAPPVVRLARRFRQNAVVVIVRGRPVRLALLRQPSPASRSWMKPVVLDGGRRTGSARAS